MAIRLSDFDKHVFTIKDLKEHGSKNLPVPVRGYFNEGSMDLLTVKDNEAAFDRYKLRPRTLKDVGTVDTTATIFGSKVRFPFGFAPAAMHELAHPDGEIASSRAAAKNNVPMALSSYSSKNLEDVVAEGKGNPYMIHVCFYKDRRKTLEITKRAEAAGFKAVLVSVDIPVLGIRPNEQRNKFDAPPGITMPMLADENGVMRHDADYLTLDPRVTWEEAIKWLRQHTKMEIWLKGITSAEDVALAIEHGIDGVLISNHGGRQLDGVPASLDALRECAPVARNKIKLAVDGGIRRGSDIFKALALGADFCLAGRIPLWGLAYNGEDGVDLALRILFREFQTTMALCGCKSVQEISKAHLSVLEQSGVLSRL
ncbi:(S)-2-hydroxy-acid oxidase [Thelonectria olida]|uniref:Oxidase FUB9 n=1 Tax=Thelonectria olida TaxID=1576542 RepID=A0A9P8VQ82_9HYPO|nr:(S)-2-hydroxy-acid oxidase [Thelonectria olida]